MIHFESNLALVTNSPIADMSASGGTIYMHFDLHSSNGNPMEILLQDASGNFNISMDDFLGGRRFGIVHNDGLFLIPTPIGEGNTQFAFSYDFTAGAPAEPIVYINGVLQSLTSLPPTVAVAITAAKWLIGGGSATILTNPLRNSNVGEVAFFVGTKLTAAQMIQLTSSKVMRQPLQYSACTHYWAMDEIADGQAYAVVGNQIVPNGDVATPWNTVTPHYSKINAADAVYLHADASDDAEQEQFDCTTDTIPANRKVGALVMDVKGYRDTGVSNPTTFTVGIATGEQTIMLPATTNGWAPSLLSYVFAVQANLDALQLYLNSPTMGSEKDIYIDQVIITPYYIWNRILDYKSGNYLVGITEAVGVANNYLSYP